jgi:hypothetical protein
VTVFSTACDSASITSSVPKWWVFGFIFNRGNRKVEWVGDESHVAFGKNSVVEKEVLMLQQPVLSSPKFGAKSSHISMQPP